MITLWLDANIATLDDNSYGIIEHAAIAISDDKIIWLGPQNNLPQKLKQQAHHVYSANHAWITPGLIDCHTHLVYAENRAQEFEWHTQGKSYTEIAEHGGGILKTMLATRAASEFELFNETEQRLQKFLAQGVTTIEIKSGYGLDLLTEIKCLDVARKLAEKYPVTIKTTYLGAHAVPPEFKKDPDKYVDFICEEVLPTIKQNNLADFVDGFCEKIAFNSKQIAKIFSKAQALNIPLKIHAEQLSNCGISKLAAKFPVVSADHLEYADESAIVAMANAGTTAVLLPGANYFLSEKQIPPIALFRKHHIPIAIATDSNPGTCPTTSLLLMLNMACILFHLTPEEALLGVTKNAAKALNMAATHGSLAEGKNADFVLWDIDHPRELAYLMGENRCIGIVKNGEFLGENRNCSNNFAI